MSAATVSLRRDATDHTGRRYGSLVVLAYVGKRYTPNGSSRTTWRCRCDCGAEAVVDGASLSRPDGAPGAVRRCRACGLKHLAARGRTQSVKLPDGRTIADVVEASGVNLNTVYRRWARGWPIERLGDPVQPHGVRRFKAAPRLPCGLEPSQREAKP